MNFEEFCKMFTENNTWANLAETDDAPLPPVPFIKKPRIKRLINSTRLGIKK